MSNVILKIENLTKIYPKSERGVKDVSFEVNKGEIHAFIGENGAGKTTIIKCIVDAYQNFDGSILINGHSNKTPEAKKFIGYVPENSIFPKEITSYEFLYEFALLSGVFPELAKERIDSYIKLLKIQDLENLKPYSFSSGQKRKIMLVQSLIHNPELIILDEPFSNLDPSARNEFLSIINILKLEGKTIFLSTHNLEEVNKVCDSLTLINKGHIYYNGIKQQDLNEIYEKYVLKNKEEFIHES